MSAINARDALRQALYEEMERDPSIVYLGEDVGLGGLLDVVRGLAERFGRDRIIPTPISEAGFVAAALGMAQAGLRPLVEIMWADLSLCAADSILNGIAKMHYKSGGLVSVPLVIMMPQGGGVGHGNSQSQCVEALFGHLPGMKIVCPGTVYDAKGLLKTSIRDPNPVIFIEPCTLMFPWPHRKGVPLHTEEVPDEEYLIPLGRADIKRTGHDVTVVCYGSMVRKTLAAAQELASSQISVEVVDLRSLIPMDVETIFTSVDKTRRLVVAQEAHRHLGFGAEIAAVVGERMFKRLLGPVLRVGALDVPIPQYPGLEHMVLPGVESIVAMVKRAMTAS